uniref:Uncharacterized protein n=1 Tax=Chromera velia CCMP2878 TaxID=1169474 RepID=A0A0G4HG92_9ALVE|eukprot:Cvel_27283.t2-p1 / transcript=Cvel_27283.t2 / gene=Cvel_27283 / organism=Chromera_velia_CCMP2878 / gene_product=hypothetical protein / transcript_product=hypothetical protein / location=Cvel_scaffold3380:2658-6825(-) / protein_length=157 / sequence_SO=supercontig / SO=protein_coding / is_pseudo=false
MSAKLSLFVTEKKKKKKESVSSSFSSSSSSSAAVAALPAESEEEEEEDAPELSSDETQTDGTAVVRRKKRLDGEKGILEWSEKSLSSALSRAQAERDGEGESVGDGQASQHIIDTAPSTDSSGSNSEAGDPDVDSYGRGVEDEGRLPVEGSARKEYS